MTAPRVSVLMPAYGHERFVGEAVRSVLAQTWTDFELVVVVDGSPDETARVAAEAAGDDPRVRLVDRKTNLGLLATLDEAVGLARGEVVTAMASDDLWLPHKLASQVVLFDDGAEWVYGRARLIDEQGAPTGEVWGAPTTGLDGLLLRNVIPALTVAMKADALHRAGGWRRGVLFEDYDLWLRLAAASPPGFVDDVIAEYRVVTGSLSQTITAGNRDAEAVDQCFEGLLAHLDDEDPRRPVVESWRRARAVLSSLLDDGAVDLRAGDASRVLAVLREHTPTTVGYLTRRSWARTLGRAEPSLGGLRATRRGWRLS